MSNDKDDAGTGFVVIKHDEQGNVVQTSLPTTDFGAANNLRIIAGEKCDIKVAGREEDKLGHH